MLGGEFWIVDLVKRRNNLKNYLETNFQNISYFGSGRDAIFRVVEDAAVKNILMPDYLCESIWLAVEKTGRNVMFYEIENDFSIGRFKVTNNDAVYIVNFFGKVEKQLYRDLKVKGTGVISDATHLLHNHEAMKFVMENSDYLLVSLRKVGAFPDGAFVASRKGIVENNGRVREEFSALRLAGFISRGYSCQENFGNDENFSVLKLAEKTIDDSRSYGFGMSYVTRNLLETYDILQNSALVRRNFNFLRNEFSKIKNIFIMQDPETFSQYFPIVFRTHETKEKIRNELFSHRIYCPIHWDTSFMNNGNSMYKRILSIPCDFRYTKDDMKRVADIIKTGIFG
jgi:hypothetical protein